jgi:hypothetical protein
MFVRPVHILRLILNLMPLTIDRNGFTFGIKEGNIRKPYKIFCENVIFLEQIGL